MVTERRRSLVTERRRSLVTERRRSLVTERRRSLVTERRRSQGRGKENYLIFFLVTMSSTTKPFSK